jgi:hypothetical protein
MQLTEREGIEAGSRRATALLLSAIRYPLSASSESSPRMMLRVQFLHALAGNVGIDLCRRQVAVT